MRQRSVYIGIMLLVLLTFTGGCGPDLAAITAKTEAIINDAIVKVGAHSSDWQRILQETIDKLTDSAQSTIRNEVSNTLHRAVAAVGIEVRCSIDFLGDRVSEDLIRIKAGLLNQPVPPPVPAVCMPVPPAIDLSLDPTRRNLITIDRYNFDTTPAIQALLVQNTTISDQTKYLFHSSHYEMTLNLGTNGVQVSSTDQKIVLRWQSQDISTIPVIASSPRCQTQTVDLPTHQFLPQDLVKGDRNFYGHGPAVMVQVLPSYNATSSSIYIMADFRETEQRLSGQRPSPTSFHCLLDGISSMSPLPVLPC